MNELRDEVELPARPKRYSTETGVLMNQVPGRCNTWSETTEDVDGDEIDAQEFTIYADEIERQLKSSLTANREQKAEIERLTGELNRYPADWWKDSSLKTWFPLTAEELDRLKAELASLRASVGEKWIEIKPDTALTDQMETGRWMGPKWVICRLECGRQGWEMIRPNDFYTHYRLLAPPTLPGEEK